MTRRQRTKLLLRLQDQLVLAIELDELERCWKDDALFRCTFTTPFPSGEPGLGADAALQIAQRLAPRWRVGGTLAGGDLQGVANEAIRVSGVTWLSFSVEG